MPKVLTHCQSSRNSKKKKNHNKKDWIDSCI